MIYDGCASRFLYRLILIETNETVIVLTAWTADTEALFIVYLHLSRSTSMETTAFGRQHWAV